MSLDIERLTGGLTPADPADPRTFPAIWNDTADDLEAVEGRVTVNEGDISSLDGRVGTNESDISQLQTDVSNLDTDDVAEATNLYYTDARVEAVIAGSDTDDLSEGATNLYYTDGRVEAVIAASDTDDLSEGSTNLYYTDARAEAAAPVQTVNTQTGDVVLGASDVGAYPDTNPDSYVDAAGAAAAAPVQSVNGDTGTVVLDAADVGALPDDAALGDLSDVVVTGASDGQLIAYNATSGDWELASAAGITVGDITALDLTWDDF